MSTNAWNLTLSVGPNAHYQRVVYRWNTPMSTYINIFFRRSRTHDSSACIQASVLRDWGIGRGGQVECPFEQPLVANTQ